MLKAAVLATGKRFVRRITAPITPEQFRRALHEAVGEGRDCLYIHSGLSSIGHFVGGPGWVPDVLLEFCGTLFQPTHSYSYSPSAHEPAPIFDARVTPSQMGLLAETFRRRPGAVRSVHSTHSIAAEGPLAAQICAKHYECDTPCGPGTPYSQLVQRGASALMLGVTFEYYTPFHTAEDDSGSAFAYEPNEIVQLRFLDEAGRLQGRASKRQNRVPPRFHEAGILLEQQGFVRRVPLGRSHLLFVSDMSKVNDFLVGRLRKIPDFLRSTCQAPLA